MGILLLFGPSGQDLRRKFHILAYMEHGAWMSTGEDAMQIQVSNPDESWYGQKKSRWAMDAIS